MKKGVDAYYERLSRKKSRRRRMVSLLLVLSMFVTSGVSWSLHGVGLTMANEAECGTEEHIHSEECYEKQLVCGLEDDEGHEHSDECYEDVLVCEKDEHKHDIVCYTGEEPEEQNEDEEFDDSDYAVMDGYVVSNVEEIPVKDEDAVSTAPATEAPSVTGSAVSTETTATGTGDASTESSETGTGTETTDTGAAETSTTTEEELEIENRIIEAERFYADGDTPQPATLPPTIQTIDNIAEGIKFTLFDYGGSELESQNNNYGYKVDWERDQDGNRYPVLNGPPYVHENISGTGINTGKNAKDDILFFAYGTPVPIGADGAVVEGGERVYNLTDANGQHYHPDKNSYAGDYNSNPQYSGNRAVQGIVGTELVDGYPVIASSGNSLAYLFNETGSDYKTVYTDVNHLLKKDTSPKGVDHLKYNSDLNYAYFNTDTKEFSVYDKTFDIINDDHHYANQTNPNKFNEDGTPYVYPNQDVNPGFKIGFFPFDQYDESRKDPNYNGNGYNHHFGMKMEASFSNNEFDRANVKEPITFKYSGDDDMWVFVDGKLVLDLGGIHEPAGGMIDFSHGLVWAQDNGATGEGLTLSEVRDKLTNPEANNSLHDYVSQYAPELLNGFDELDEHNVSVHRDPDYAWNEFPKPIGVNTSQTSSDKWIVKPITAYISDWYSSGKAYKNHDINMFYLERGGCYSNLAMEMNLPTLKPLSIIKNVEYKEHLAKTYDETEYEFQIWEWKNNEWIKPTDLPDDGYFKISAGERKKFDQLAQDRIFKVVEVGVDPNIIEKVELVKDDGTTEDIPIVNGEAAKEGGMLKDMNSYTFKNTIQEDFTDVSVKKKWEPELEQGSPLADFTVKFKVMRTDSVTGEVKQVALKDTNGVKKRTFTISSSEWAAGVSINHLLARYGDHFYTYTVEELNTPNGYKAAYGTDPTGAMVITNTDITKMQINVKKNWENAPDTKPRVRLKLTRERIGYEGSKPTALTVNIVDEGGNLIKTKTFEATDAEKIYAGGSAEIRCDIPNGAVVIDPDNPQKSPDSLNAKYDDGFIVLSNLAAIDVNNPTVVPNEVTIRVNTVNAVDSLLLLHHSFTGDTNTWIANSGDHTVGNSDSYYAKGNSLAVSGRDKAWHGARLNLDPNVFKMNKTYTFSTYVRYTGGPDQIPFKFTLNDGLNKDNNGSFHQISQVDVPRGEWTQLTGTVTLPAELDPYNMYIIVETSDGNNNPLVSEFLMDEFTAVEGSKNVSVDSDGKVHVTIVEETVLMNDAFTNDACGWRAHGNSTATWHSDWNGRIEVTNRKESWHGVEKSLASVGLVRGETYTLSTYIVPDGTTEFKVTMQNGNVYRTLATFSMSSGGNYETQVTIPSDIDPASSIIYIETTETDSPFKKFNLCSFSIRKKNIANIGDVTGYEHTATGEYVTNYNNYIIALDPDSVTDPMHLKGEYEIDRVNNNDPNSAPWSKVIILPDADPSWTYHWDNEQETDAAHKIDEDSAHFLYRYHLEEEWIDSEGNTIGLVDGKYMSQDGNYLVTYTDNDVATNDPQNPILVTNKYIWYKLPATGGVGVDLIYGLGILLAITGLTGGIALKKRERRSG